MALIPEALRVELPDHSFCSEKGNEIEWSTPNGMWRIIFFDAREGHEAKIFGPGVQIQFQKGASIDRLLAILQTLGAIEINRGIRVERSTHI